MPASSLHEMIKEIQFKTGLNIQQIADKLGYSRPYLSKTMNNEDHHEMIEERIKHVFPNMYTTTSTVKTVKSGVNNDLAAKVDELEKRIAAIEAQLQIIVTLLKR
jgi:transcriptional regulator with XRE-family HTH domain